jgi:hypothetical protein
MQLREVDREALYGVSRLCLLGTDRYSEDMIRMLAHRLEVVVQNFLDEKNVKRAPR